MDKIEIDNVEAEERGKAIDKRKRKKKVLNRRNIDNIGVLKLTY